MHGTYFFTFKPSNIDQYGLRRSLFLNIANSWKNSKGIFLIRGVGEGGAT